MGIGFMNEEKIIENNLLVKETFTNAICYGQTGSGKTTGFILPNIQNRMKLNHGLLIYDFKGNLHEQVKHIAKKQQKLVTVYEIGKPWGKNIDILKHSSPKSLESMFATIAGTRENDYWTNSAYNLFSNIYFMLKSLIKVIDIINSIDKTILHDDFEVNANKYNPTIENIFNFVKSSTDITKFFTIMNNLIAYIDIYFDEILFKYLKSIDKTILNSLLLHKNELHLKCDSLSEYHKMGNDGSEVGGKFGVLYVLNSTLQSIANKKCFSNDEFDIVEKLQAGNTVIINVEDFSEQMLSFFNFSIYNRLIRQTSISKNRNPITIFIDEAQKVLNATSMPDVDVCRENNFEFILSTQDKSLLENKVGTLNTYLLLRNVTSQYSFITVEPQDTKINTVQLKKFECVDMIKNIKVKTKPIFINKDDLFMAEYLYQTITTAYKFINMKIHKPHIVKYSSLLEVDDIILVCFRDGTSKEVPLTHGTVEIDEYIKKNDTNKIEKLVNKS